MVQIIFNERINFGQTYGMEQKVIFSTGELLLITEPEKWNLWMINIFH